MTVSDRAARGIYPDLSGPALEKAVLDRGWEVAKCCVVADEPDQIGCAIAGFAAEKCHVILATGGTGIGPRDITPEVVRSLATRELPGFGEVMRMKSLPMNPHAILSRAMGAVLEQSLVLCLPGKPKAAVECLSFVADAIPHAVEVIRSLPNSTHSAPAG